MRHDLIFSFSTRTSDDIHGDNETEARQLAITESYQRQGTSKTITKAQVSIVLVKQWQDQAERQETTQVGFGHDRCDNTWGTFGRL